MYPFRRHRKGLSLWEVVLVTVIAGATAALAMPKVKMGIENRQAKQALETLRSIHHAIRMYEVDRGSMPANLQALQDAGYLSPTEYPYVKTGTTDTNGFEYAILLPGNVRAQARRYSTVTVQGPCYEECDGCDCDTICPPPTTQQNAIRTIQICANQTNIRDVLGSSGSQAGLLATIGTSPCPAS